MNTSKTFTFTFSPLFPEDARQMRENCRGKNITTDTRRLSHGLVSLTLLSDTIDSDILADVASSRAETLNN
jgi:hypothetical protein